MRDWFNQYNKVNVDTENLRNYSQVCHKRNPQYGNFPPQSLPLDFLGNTQFANLENSFSYPKEILLPVGNYQDVSLLTQTKGYSQASSSIPRNLVFCFSSNDIEFKSETSFKVPKCENMDTCKALYFEYISKVEGRVFVCRRYGCGKKMPDFSRFLEHIQFKCNSNAENKFCCKFFFCNKRYKQIKGLNYHLAHFHKVNMPKKL